MYLSKTKQFLCIALLLIAGNAVGQVLPEEMEGIVGNKVYRNGKLIGIVVDEHEDRTMIPGMDTALQKVQHEASILEKIHALEPYMSQRFEELKEQYPAYKEEIQLVKQEHNALIHLFKNIQKDHLVSTHQQDENIVFHLTSLYDTFVYLQGENPTLADALHGRLNHLYIYKTENMYGVGDISAIIKTVLDLNEVSKWEHYGYHSMAPKNDWQTFSMDSSYMYWREMSEWLQSFTLPRLYSWDAYLYFLEHEN